MELNCSVAQILAMIEPINTVDRLDHSFFVHRIASIEGASPNDLAILFDADESGVFDAVSLASLKRSKAGVILTSRSDFDDPRCIVVNNAIAAYERLVKQVRGCCEDSYIHPSAVVDPQAVLGDRVRIGAQVYIGANCSIGDDVEVHPGVKILEGTIVGNGTIIHAGTVIGSDGYRYIATKQGMRKVPQIGIVRIGNNVEIGANCCIDRAGFDETVIGDGVKLDNLVHIAHNVRIGAHTAIIAQTGIAGGARIGMGCQIGGQVGIKDHVVIGNNVKIVSKTVVIKDVADGQIIAGIPAMPVAQWRRLVVILGQLPQLLTQLQEMRLRIDEYIATQTSWWSKITCMFSFLKK